MVKLTFQEKVMKDGGITKPFMAFPPGSVHGSLAKQDDSEFTDEEIQKLNDAKLQFGGKDTEWTKMTGGCCLIQISRTVNYI